MRSAWLGLPAIISALSAAPIGAQTPGDTALIFTLKTLDGEAVSLSDFRGHPVVVNFWGTWCPPCRVELPLLAQAYRDHQAEGLVVLALNARDQEVSARAVRKFVAEFDLPFPVLLDEHGRLWRRYGVTAFPTMVFIGADGVVRAVVIGPTSEVALERHLAEILPVP